MKPALSPPRRSRQVKHRVRITGAAIAAAVGAALVVAMPADAVAATDVRAGASDLADRVVSLRQLLAEKSSAVEAGAPWSDRALTPGTQLSQWKKWNNG
jgi:actin-like ATPase involved in cell morphogenesis